ncbi:hypothetical protein DJ524_07235, partial [Sulfolobus sp. D5]
VYTTLEPIIVMLLPITFSDYYTSLIYFRDLIIIIAVFIILLYPVLYYSIRQINILSYWELRR